MEINPIAYFRSPFPEKFGVPRQAGLAPGLVGRVVFEPPYRSPDALRGLDGFDYLWLIWGFSANSDLSFKATVRPPRLGGNARVGVFASRSPFRPNPLGLSSVRIKAIGPDYIEVLGADLMDGTPIYDIKPYVEYADSHPGVRSGFVDSNLWEPLEVIFPAGAENRVEDLETLRDVLSLDPRPSYHDDPSKEYTMAYGPHEIRFRVEGKVLIVNEILDFDK